ncbi:prosaposin isoform X1 [Syngnathus acus]|uniref:prosaposin isoform X1 n=1 Tax=Syngnathus acus TaxID=161584 RepID=UPI001885C29B|nr:prosaposin isoform X1 [Syngnathus acus]
MFMLSSQLTSNYKALNAIRSSRLRLDLQQLRVSNEPENSRVMMLLTLLFVSSAVATPLLGTEQCARGPPYWCQNVKTASLCGAVTHCQQNVWNKPQMKSVPCNLCKEVVMVVSQVLKDNATQTEVIGYLEKACQLIPEQGLSDECKEMVDDYYPIVIAIIMGELEDPGVACGAIGLCRSQQMALAKFQDQLLSNEIPQIDLSKSASPFLLNVPGLLYPQEKPKQETPVKGSSDVCQDCIKFMTDAQAQQKENSSFVNSLIAKFEEDCDKMGPGVSDMCKQYISMYGSLVLQKVFATDQDPKECCSIVGFCSAGVESTPMLKLQAADILPAAKTVPALSLVPATKVESTKTKPMVRVRDSAYCAICEFVMKELESMLEDQTTEEQVIESVEKVCNYLPQTLTSECKDLIETYGQAIIELLVQQADPKTICTVLALCKDATRAFVPALDKTVFKTGGYCKVCKMAVAYIDGILEKNATEEQIQEAVRKVCSFLPDSYQTECDQLVEQYEPMMVQMLLQMLDPDFVCLQVGACPEALRRLLGREQCTFGPSFWCRNMETATQCNAVDHCKRHMWA